MFCLGKWPFRFPVYAAMIVALASVFSCHESPIHDSSSMNSNHEAERNRMVDQFILPHDINNPAVIAAMRRVPRHRFVPEINYP